MQTTVDTIGCVGNTILTRSGVYFDLAKPLPEQVFAEDIAMSLGSLCRFNGHVPFYSVAEHSYHAYEIAREQQPENLAFQKAVLLHDAAEAYVGDVSKPLKIMLPDFPAIEARVMAVINQALQISTIYTIAIKSIDHALLKAEKQFLLPHHRIKWPGLAHIQDVTVGFHLWGPEQASEAFYDALIEVDQELAQRAGGVLNA